MKVQIIMNCDAFILRLQTKRLFILCQSVVNSPDTQGEKEIKFYSQESMIKTLLFTIFIGSGHFKSYAIVGSESIEKY